MARSSRNGTWVLAGIALLVVAIVASATGCASNTPTDSNASATTTVAGQTGTPGGAPAGAPSSTPGGPPSTTEGPATSPTAGTSTTTTETTSAGNDSTSTTQAPTTTTSLAKGSYSDGIYLVGTDITSGLYHGSVNGDKGHWEIASDANGDKFVASGDPTGPFYVKVTYGQYLKLSSVVVKKASTTAADPLATSKITDGTYRVGYDIAPGWYNGTVTGGLGYWEISSDANGTTLVANEYPMSSFKLKVKDGQYLTLRGVIVSQ